MHNRTSGVQSRARWLAPLAALSLLGCPKQELAPLGPCTVSAVTERVDQTGVDQVDLLFVIDNSGSMASEQERLGELLPTLVKVLTTGDKKPDDPPADRTNNPRYFTPVKSLHIGVVTTNMGGIDDPQQVGEAIQSCGGLGDDARLQTSTKIAVEGVIAAERPAGGVQEFEGFVGGDVVLEPDPDCGKITNVPKYQRFMATGMEATDSKSSADVAETFRCVARVGVRGCPFEQQLEAMWKALAPAEAPEDAEDPTLYQFLNGSRGQGTRFNDGFLREEAILAIMHVSDEEDCSLDATKGDEAKLLFDTRRGGLAEEKYGREINLRCGKYGEKDKLVWPASRYVDGLKSLKPDYPDRIIFGAIVGLPTQLPKDSTIDDILKRPDMQFKEEGNTMIATPSCTRFNQENPDRADKAYPPRRFLEVAKGFDSNAVLHSICADDYTPALDLLIDRIAKQLKGNCLPRQLRPNAQGIVECEVFELLPSSETKCDPNRGHDRDVEERVIRENGKNITRKACHMAQAAVKDGKVENKKGWYYDEVSDEIKQCAVGEQQRIAFTFGDLPSGAGATFECFQPVAKVDVTAKGFDAVNTRCFSGMDTMNDLCPSRDDEENGYKMMCVTPLQTCQIKCEVDPDCPPGWICEQGFGFDMFKEKFCQQPTCQAGG